MEYSQKIRMPSATERNTLLRGGAGKGGSLPLGSRHDEFFLLEKYFPLVSAGRDAITFLLGNYFFLYVRKCW